MASLQRTIKRKMKFNGMNKQQREMWLATHGKKGRTRPKHVNADITEKLGVSSAYGECGNNA